MATITTRPDNLKPLYDRYARCFTASMTKVGERLPRGDGRLIHMIVSPMLHGEPRQQVVVLRVDRKGCHFPESSPAVDALLYDEWYLMEFRSELSRMLREAESAHAA